MNNTIEISEKLIIIKINELQIYMFMQNLIIQIYL